MKRSLSFIFLLGLLQSFSFSYFQITDLEKKGIIGKASSIKKIIYSESSKAENKRKETVVFDNLTTYNTDGNRQITSEFKDGILFSHTIYNYNEHGILIGCDEYNTNNSLYLSISYLTDDKGFITEAKYNRILQKTYDNDRFSIDVEYDKYYQNLFTLISYKNDFKGYVLKEEYFNPDSSVSFMLNYKYDYKHNKVEIKYYNKNGTLSWRSKLKYDSKSNKKESKLFKSNRLALLSKFTYEFDQNGNWVKRIETRHLYDNFFGQDLDNNTYTTIRKIEYY